MKSSWLLSVGLAWSQACGLVAAGEVRVAVAANFAAPFQQIAAGFTKQTGHAVKVSAASSGKLLLQIQHGAPFEVFLSADAEAPRKLAAGGLAVSDSAFTYAMGKLVLWSPDPSRIDAEGKALQGDALRRVAVANPKLAPYGAAAVEAMRALGLLERLSPRLVQGESIAQTYQFVATGNADAGFVALSQVQVPGQALRGAHWLLPERLYTPIRQDAVLLKKGEGQVAAIALMRYLRSEPVRALIRTWGYGLDP